jgi:hypothetical protein
MTKSNPELAADIESWLSASNQSGSEVVHELIDELKSPSPDLQPWAGLNFSQVIPLRVPRERVLSIVDPLRNSLVLLPIALTWFGLWRAASAFSDASQRSTQQLNFLVYWEREMSGIFKLSNIAIIDFVLLMLIFGATVFSDYIGRNSTLRVALEAQHETLIANLERSLAQYRYLTLPELYQYASQTVTQIESATQKVDATVTSLAATASNSEAALIRVDQLFTGTIQPMLLRMDSVLTNLDSAAGIHQNLVSVVQQAQTGLSNTQASLSQTVAAIETAVRSSTQQSQQMLSDNLTTAQQSYQSSLRSLESGLQNLILSLEQNVSNTLGDAVRTASAVLNQMSQSSSAALTSISDSAQTVADSSRDLKAVLASVEFGAKQLDLDLTSIATKLDEIRKRL